MQSFRLKQFGYGFDRPNLPAVAGIAGRHSFPKCYLSFFSFHFYLNTCNPFIVGEIRVLVPNMLIKPDRLFEWLAAFIVC
jgi:hypothetical protein